MKKKVASALLVSIFAVSAPTFAGPVELVTNGNFEGYTGTALSGGSSEVYAGSEAITGWTVSGYVDYGGLPFVGVVNGRYGAISGNSIRMPPQFSHSILSQSISTVAGKAYTLNFDLSQDRNITSASVIVSFIDGTNQTAPPLGQAEFFGASTFKYPDGTTLLHETMSFTASSFSTILQFRSTHNLPYAVIDNVSVTAAIPEPETYAMMLAGLGLLGLTARRRRQKLNA